MRFSLFGVQLQLHTQNTSTFFALRLIFGMNSISRVPTTERFWGQGDYMATSEGIGHDVCFPLANGLRHGQGRRVWANGATYVGRRDNQARLR